MSTHILAIDQGTTSTRAVIFSREGIPLATHQLEFKQYFPRDGWVEHNPEEIWQTTVTCCRSVLQKAKLSAKQITAIGISNQRETTLIWDRKTGACIYPAIVWQDRRTANFCEHLLQDPKIVEILQQKTGLLLDPYFSATKIAWILDHVPMAREHALNHELAFGTVDSYLLWRLTGGKKHYTDVTNASRTLLFNIHTTSWDEELLQLFNIPQQILPEVLVNNAHFGTCDKNLFDHPIPITGMMGDQQAAAFGQACFEPGMIKSTYGTGCFVLLNTGHSAVTSKNRLLTTIAYQLGQQPIYSLEGSIFIAGAAVQWLRDALHLIKNAAEAEEFAKRIDNTAGVYLIPAFTGLGAPYWDPNARGALLGLTRDTQAEHIVRAALEAVCYQTRDLLDAMARDYTQPITTLRVDGGMVANNWLLQFLADILALPIQRPRCIETSSLGAAYLAGIGAGIFSSLDEIKSLWVADKNFTPQMNTEERNKLYQGWQKAMNKICSN